MARADVLRPLPRGRHRLPRAEVERSQRERLLVAMAETMAAKGFVATTVADVIAAAGVSRESFYQQFSSKADCFMAALDAAGSVLFADLGHAATGAGTPLERCDRLLERYLDVVAANPGHARLYLVEVYAAGPAAMDRRAALQAGIVDVIADLLGVGSPEGRFACELLVAGTAALVTRPLLAGDLASLRALRPAILAVVEGVLVADL